MIADQILLPWDWFSDGKWMLIGNLLWWPTYLGYVFTRDRLDQVQKRRRWKARQHA